MIFGNEEPDYSYSLMVEKIANNSISKLYLTLPIKNVTNINELLNALSENKSITSISFYNWRDSNSDSRKKAKLELFHMLKKLKHKNISYLSIDGFSVQAILAKTIAEFILSLDTLNSIRFFHLTCEPQVFAPIMQTIVTRKNLYHLHLSLNQIGNDNLSLLAEGIKKLPLFYLYLYEENKTTNNADIIAQLIKNANMLRHLTIYLDGEHIVDSAPILKVLKENKTLVYLVGMSLKPPGSKYENQISIIMQDTIDTNQKYYRQHLLETYTSLPSDLIGLTIDYHNWDEIYGDIPNFLRNDLAGFLEIERTFHERMKQKSQLQKASINETISENANDDSMDIEQNSLITQPSNNNQPTSPLLFNSNISSTGSATSSAIANLTSSSAEREESPKKKSKTIGQ